MVIDSSALVAIIFGEPEAAAFDRAIRATQIRLVAAATVVEFTIVLSRRLATDARAVVDTTLNEYGLRVVDMDATQVALACEAAVRFGKGRHPARLNFGDCFAYALARSTGEPLLFKGEDFTHTDVRAA